MAGLTKIADYMVRDPVCAGDWQPISFVRQQMLLNSFSFLPVQLDLNGQTAWYLISDSALASYIRAANGNGQRRALLERTVLEAVKDRLLRVDHATLVSTDTPIRDVLEKYSGQPLLVVDGSNRMVGIVTAFDLL
jgi:CBS domain-containing protein